MTVVRIAVTGLIGLLSVAMAGEGLIKLIGFESQVEGFREFGYPQWFRLVVGSLELFGAGGLLVGLLVTDRRFLLSGSAVLVAVLCGAIATHARVGDPVTEILPAAVLLVLCVIAVASHTWLLARRPRD